MSQTKPHVAVYAQTSERASQFLDFIVHNIGLGPAYDIRLNVDPDFEYNPEKQLSDLGIVKNGWSYLAPNQKLLVCTTDGRHISFDTKIEVSISWKSATRHDYQATNVIGVLGVKG